MSAAVFAGEYPIGSYPPGSRTRDRGSLSPGPSGAAGEITVVQGMVSTLDTLTAPGRRHTMGRIVSFISDAIEGLGSSIGVRNRSTLTDLLSPLAHESERLSPDVQVFCRGADSLLELLLDL
jgi:hypothetical protein